MLDHFVSTAYYARLNRANYSAIREEAKRPSVSKGFAIISKEVKFPWDTQIVLGRREKAWDTTKIEVFSGSLQRPCWTLQDNLHGSVGFSSDTIDVSTVKE